MELEKVTRVISVTATGLAGVILGVTGCVSAQSPDRPSAPAPVILQEDDPGWDCRTMGDRNCLPRAIVPPSPRMV